MTEHPRGSLPCAYCDEAYDLGQPYAKGSFVYYPDGEYAYWRHCRETPHQEALAVYDHHLSTIMRALPGALERGKAIQSQARDPRYHKLREVLR